MEDLKKKRDELLNVKPDIQFDNPPREKILALAQKMTPRSGVTITSSDPEYYGIACITSDEEADILLKMKIRKPYTFAQLLKLTGLDEKTLQKDLDNMALQGMIEYNWENKKREKQYILPILVPGSAEFTNMRWEEMEEHPELARYFDRMTLVPLEKVGSLVPMGGAGIGMHVIPVEQAIQMENKSVSVEHISHWLDKYEGKYAASPCSCRMGRHFLGDATPDDYEDWCIGLGDYATYLVETKKGRYITKEECLKILEKAEKNGFVHQITNIDGKDKIFAICNCNKDSCTAIRSSQLYNAPNLMRSAYVAHVDNSKCVACGKCVEGCPAGALKLGQKLCRKSGPVTYPRQELPGNVPWGPDKWNFDYRDTNRVNCHKTGTSPCKTACPAHVSVQGYIKLASEGRYKDALELIKKDNPFPAICGRVCNRRCEKACTRGTIDNPVAIDAIKKFIAEQDLKKETRFVPEVVMPSTRLEHWDEKIAIIGAGPSGLSCAYFLAMHGYKPTVFEKNKELGGMMTYGIPSYKLEKDVITAEIDILKDLGVEFKTGVHVGKDITLADLRKEGYKAFYLAIGCQGGKRPDVPGDDATNTYIAVDFLHNAYENHDKKLNGNVVVIGGGNVAIDCARVAMRIGADSVSMFSLEKEEEMPASVDEIKEAKEEKVEIKNSYGPKEVRKDENGNVVSVIFKKCVSVFGENHKFSPKYDENELLEVKADYVIYAIGQDVIWGDLLKGENVEMAKGNYPKADPVTYQTTVDDIFIGGDLLTGPKFVIDAIAGGHNAADSLHLYVRPHADLFKGRNRREFIAFDVDDITLPNYDKTPRQEEGIDNNVKPLSFEDNRLTLSEEQVKKEASRCLGCGVTIVDPNKCYGCGICTVKCKFDAIHLERDNPKASRMHSNEQKLKILLPIIIQRKIKFKRLAKKQAKAKKKAEK